MATSDFLIALMSEINPYQRSADDALVMPLSEFYQQGLEQLKSSAIPPLAQSRLARAFAAGLYRVRDLEPALSGAEMAVTLASRVAPLSPEHVEAMVARASALGHLNRFEPAQEDYQWLLQRIDDDVPLETVATVHQGYGSMLYSAGRLDDALRQFELAQAIVGDLALSERVKQMILALLMGHSETLQNLERRAEARSLSDRQVELARAWYGDNSMRLVQAHGHAATLWASDPAQGVSMARTAFESAQRILGPTHPETLTMHNNYAQQLGWARQHEEAVEQYAEVIRRAEQANRSSGDFYQNMAVYLRKLDRLEEALGYTEQAQQTYGEQLPADHWRLAMPLITQTDIALTQGQPADAYLLAEQAIAQMAPLAEDSYIKLAARGMAIVAKADQGQCAPAELFMPESEVQRMLDSLNEHPIEVHLGRLDQGRPCP